MNETKKCKHCQSEIAKKAKVCPVCKRNLKANGCLTFIVAFIIVGIITIIGAQTLNDNVQKELSGVSDETEFITLNEFNKIKNGMSYDEVCEIVGSEGTVSSESGSGQYSLKIITWYGNGTAGSNANVSFTNNEVSGKAQVGLK